MIKFKKALSIGTTVLAALTIAGCSNNKTSKESPNKSVKTTHQQKKPEPKVADYPNIKTAEAALSKGKNLKGKRVQFKIKKFEPQSSFGYKMVLSRQKTSSIGNSKYFDSLNISS